MLLSNKDIRIILLLIDMKNLLNIILESELTTEELICI